MKRNPIPNAFEAGDKVICAIELRLKHGGQTKSFPAGRTVTVVSQPRSNMVVINFRGYVGVISPKYLTLVEVKSVETKVLPVWKVQRNQRTYTPERGEEFRRVLRGGYGVEAVVTVGPINTVEGELPPPKTGYVWPADVQPEQIVVEAWSTALDNLRKEEDQRLWEKISRAPRRPQQSGRRCAKCGEPAEMMASLGLACPEHYDELSS